MIGLSIAMSCRNIDKKCSAMITRKFNDKEYLLIGDKIGDITAYAIPSLDQKTFLIGHCASVITELVRPSPSSDQ